MNIQQTVEIFHNKRKPDHRYASFDYCYNYFSQQSKDDILSDMEKSCLVLGFYLASWGMFRGSSFLLGRSLKTYEPLIRYIAAQKESEINPWNIDVDSYTDSHIDYLLKQYKDIEYAIMGDEEHESLTLVTKIMLGVFGHTPAVDTYFKKTFSELFGKRCMWVYCF